MARNEDPGYWSLPGLKFSDKDEPMTHNMKLRSLLLQTSFCQAGKSASRRDRFEANLRAIFKCVSSFYDYSCFGDEFWDAFARGLCHYWDGYVVEEVVHLYAEARRRYLRDHSHDREISQISDEVANIVNEIDIFLRRISHPKHTQPSASLRQTMMVALKKIDLPSYMWPPMESSSSGDFSFSIKGLAARTDTNLPRGGMGQYHPDGSSLASDTRLWKTSEQFREPNDNGSLCLASRISAPPVSGSITVEHEFYNSANQPRESPQDTLKRRPSFCMDRGPAKRQAIDENTITTPTILNQQKRIPLPNKPPSPANLSSHTAEYTNFADIATPNGTSEDLIPQVNLGTHVPKEPIKQPKTLPVSKIESQLAEIGEVLGKRFDGIEAHVAAVREQISKNAALHADAARTRSLSQEPPPHYVDEYLSSRDHNLLVKNVNGEIRRIKRYLLYGLRDHEHDQTSDAWKKMEGIWAALDEAEHNAN